MSGYGFLRQPRWLALGFLVLLVVPSFVLLSRWQLSRLDERRHANAVVESNAQRAPVVVDSVMTPGAPTSSIGDAQTWRPVTATGHYVVANHVPDGFSRQVGLETDFSLTYRFSDDISVILAYDHFITGRFFRDATGSRDDIDYGYLMVQFNLAKTKLRPPAKS